MFVPLSRLAQSPRRRLQKETGKTREKLLETRIRGTRPLSASRAPRALRPDPYYFSLGVRLPLRHVFARSLARSFARSFLHILPSHSASPSACTNYAEADKQHAKERVNEDEAERGSTALDSDVGSLSSTSARRSSFVVGVARAKHNTTVAKFAIPLCTRIRTRSTSRR